MTYENDPRTKLDEAADAVRDATDAVRKTSARVAGAIKADRGPQDLVDRLSALTRRAPLRSLLVAFLAGVLLSR